MRCENPWSALYKDTQEPMTFVLSYGRVSIDRFAARAATQRRYPGYNPVPIEFTLNPRPRWR